MYIPKFKIVNIIDLANEAEINTYQLIEAILQYLGAGDAKKYFNYPQPLFLEDHIRTWKDDDWDEIPKCIKDAYAYLCSYEKFYIGDCFIWRV